MENKVILITGSSRGIGAATARLASNRGAKVIVHGKSDSEKLQDIADELGAQKLVCDVTDKQAVQDAVDRVRKEHGKIDALVNSAGIVRPKPFLELEDQDWSDEFNVNVLGTVHFCQAVIPLMQEKGSGSIVNISSIRGLPSMASNRGISYSVSKASVVGLTAALAKEFAPAIRVNSIAPGFTETEMAETWTDAVWEQANSSLLGRVAQPEEIASAILFLAGDDSSFVTGRTIAVDGGYELSGK